MWVQIVFNNNAPAVPYQSPQSLSTSPPSPLTCLSLHLCTSILLYIMSLQFLHLLSAHPSLLLPFTSLLLSSQPLHIFLSGQYLAVGSGRVDQSTGQCKYTWIHLCRRCSFLHSDRGCSSTHWYSGHSLLLASQSCNCRCSQEPRWWPAVVIAVVH